MMNWVRLTEVALSSGRHAGILLLNLETCCSIRRAKQAWGECTFIRKGPDDVGDVFIVHETPEQIMALAAANAAPRFVTLKLQWDDRDFSVNPVNVGNVSCMERIYGRKPFCYIGLLGRTTDEEIMVDATRDEVLALLTGAPATEEAASDATA